MIQALFEYPKQTLVGNPISKSKIYKNAKPSTAIQKHFVSDVTQILWKAVLAPRTTNLASSNEVLEIQVFSLILKKEKLNHDLLRYIDKAIVQPIFFEICFGEKIKMVAAYKRPSDVDSNKQVVDHYFESDWFPKDKKRQSLPYALNLKSLYEFMLQELLPGSPSKSENLKEQMSRLAEVRSKEYACKLLQSRIRKEKQFNKKVVMNAQLRDLKIDLEALV